MTEASGFAWAEEDKHKSPTDRTKEVIKESLGNLVECLSFTVETHEEFSSGWLPTLDMSLKVDENNKVQYQFFEKPTASNKCLQSDTALAQNCLVQSLVQDVIRRMLNCSPHVSPETRRKVIDDFAQKMVNSGHSIEESRRNILSGLKGWRTKVNRAEKQGRPLHRSAKESAAGRRIKKLTGKANWFKERKVDEDDLKSEESITAHNQHKQTKCDSRTNNKFPNSPPQAKNGPARITSVIFIEYTRGGSLA